MRATSTLLAGAGLGLPGDGWRSIWQLAIVAVLAVGIKSPGGSRAAVAVVGVIYAMATGLEAFHRIDLFGVAPVDMCDRLVHPAPAGLAVLCLLVARRSARITMSVMAETFRRELQIPLFHVVVARQLYTVGRIRREMLSALKKTGSALPKRRVAVGETI